MVEGEHTASFIRRAGARLPGQGDLVGDCWRIDAALGQGGMGGVYRATDVRTGRQAALKVMLPGDASRGRLQRFEREAQVLARIAHPGVVRIHASGAHQGMPWFVMELVEGPDLDRLITESGPLDPDRAAELVEQAARAVAACHAAGVIHRDLKPANVIVGPEGAKVVDFGLARGSTDERLTRTGELVGTPVTMAPEQLTGGAVDARADVYALGAMLYLALTGQPVYVATSLQELVARACHGDPTPPRRLRPDVSPGLEEVCLHALRPRADERYATALELADDLARVRRREVPLASTASSLRDRVRRRDPRTLLRLLGAAAGALVLLAGAVWLFVARPRAEARAALAAATQLEAGPLAAWDLGLGPGAAPDPDELAGHAAALRAAASRLGAEDAVAAERAAERLDALRGLVAGGPPGTPPQWPLDALLEALRLRAAGRPAEAAARVARVLSREPAHPTARRLEAALWTDRVAASPRELKALVAWAQEASRTDEERAAATAAARVGLAAGLRLLQRDAAAASDEGETASAALAAASAHAAALGVDAAAVAALRVEAAEAEADAWADAGARALAAGPAADRALARRLAAVVGPHHGPRLLATVDAIVLARVDAAVALGPSPPLESVMRASGLEDTLHHGLERTDSPPQRYVDLVRSAGDAYMDLDPALSLPYLRLASHRTRACSTIVRRLEARLGREALLALGATRPGSVAFAMAAYVLADETPDGGDPWAAAERIPAATRGDLAPPFLSEAWTAVTKRRASALERAARSGAPERRQLALRDGTIAAARRVLEIDADPDDLANATDRWALVGRRVSKDETRLAWETGLEHARRRVAAATAAVAEGQPTQLLDREQKTLAELYAHAALDLVDFDRRPGFEALARDYVARSLVGAEPPQECLRSAILVHLALGDAEAAEAAATRGLSLHFTPGGRLPGAATRAALARGDLAAARERLAAAQRADPTWPFTELERELKALEDAAAAGR